MRAIKRWALVSTAVMAFSATSAQADPEQHVYYITWLFGVEQCINASCPPPPNYCCFIW
jgi:hypothetical protein